LSSLALGWEGHNAIAEGQPECWRRVVEVNLFGAYNVIRAAGRALSGTARSATIVAISSLNATLPVPGYSAYCASKAGLEMLIKVAALELAPGIRVNGIAPGPVETDKGALQMLPGVLDGIRRRHPLGRRLASASEIAAVAVFLASDAASWITGQVIVVDGGVGLQFGEVPKRLAAPEPASASPPSEGGTGDTTNGGKTWSVST
jgi:NAD(P)-dependent dehydrogenase (short-subunit alcohol dehydrogenase family)